MMMMMMIVYCIITSFLVILPFSVQGFQSLSLSLTGHFGTALYHSQAFWEEATIKNTQQLYDEEIIRRLQEHYRELQDELFDGLAKEDKTAAAQVSKEIFKTAADLTQVEEYEQYLKLKESQQHLQQAQEEVREAEEWVKQAHKIAEEKLDTFELSDRDDEDSSSDASNRERDGKISQAAQHCQDFAKNILLDAKFEQLQAQVEYEHAEELLEVLRNNEQLLQKSLEKIEEEEYLLDYWYQVELPKHQSFLEDAQGTIRTGNWKKVSDAPECSVAPWVLCCDLSK